MQLTPLQKEYMIGFLLGDASVEKKTANANCRIRFHHSIKQLPYIKWKHKLLSPHSGKLTEYQRGDSKREKGIFKGCRFYTYARPCFNIYREIFYAGGKKIVPENIDPLINENSLATWFLDDGSRDKRFTFRFHTNSYTLRECDCLQQALWENFSIEAKVHKTPSLDPDRGFILYVGTKGGKKLHSIVKGLVEKELPLFHYKLFEPCND